MRASAALIATAASTAVPPRLSPSTPICTAKGWAAATMPWRARVIDRVAKARPSGRSAPDTTAAPNMLSTIATTSCCIIASALLWPLGESNGLVSHHGTVGDGPSSSQ